MHRLVRDSRSRAILVGTRTCERSKLLQVARFGLLARNASARRHKSPLAENPRPSQYFNLLNCPVRIHEYFYENVPYHVSLTGDFRVGGRNFRENLRRLLHRPVLNASSISGAIISGASNMANSSRLVSMMVTSLISSSSSASTGTCGRTGGGVS